MTLDRIFSPTLANVLPPMPQWAVALLVVGFLFVSIVMILIVLIQRPQGGGLSGAFGAGGGGSAGQTAFGARTGDALTIATITIFVLYLLVAVFLNYAIVPPEIENPSITAAAETAPEGVVDDSESFDDLPPATVESPAEDGPVGPVPEAPTDDAPSEDTMPPSDG